MENFKSQSDRKKAYFVLAASSLLLALGNSGGPLISRLYFVHGGNRIWLSSWLQTAGFPILLLPLSMAYAKRRRATANGLFFMNLPALLMANAMGIITGLADYLYAYGVARLPVSTSSLIIATQLVFTAFFAFFLVKQKFTFYSINAVILLTIGAVVLGALGSNGDRPANETSKDYYLGFVTTVAASALTGLLLPLLELVYRRAKSNGDQAVVMSFGLVMEVQMVMCIVATTFCTIGMLVNRDFQITPREAKHYELGEAKYYLVLVWSAIIWQLFFLGATGVIFCASSLFSGILIAVLLPVTEVLSIMFFDEKFKADKWISLALSLWGLTSYFYGEYKQSKKNKPETVQMELSRQLHLSP